jgi:L-proline---[L-prolyl-carrier protein] ligase
VTDGPRMPPQPTTERPQVIGDLLESQARVRGDDEALTDGTARLTWREYRDGAARLASALAARDVGPGDRVGVHLPKSADSFVAVHAIVRLGAVVVPVDWFAPQRYVAEVLSDAGAEVVVSTASGRRLEALREAAGVRDVVDPSSDADRRAAAPVAGARPSDPAYIVYTSGSTGRPKGIVHTHASALAYARRAAETYGLTADDRLANIAPLHFDQSTFELYAAPLVGAAVLVVPDGVLRFPASLSELVARERITVWYSVPFAISQLTSRGALDDRDLGALRWVLFGGEPFPPAALAEAMRRLPGVRFSNVYGPAEVNQCTHHHLDAPPSGDEQVPIGRPWADTEILVVDGSDHVVVPGETGELLVSTDTMMSGYWGRPDLTAASTTVRADAGATRRWYRTGDLVRERDDGLLVFIGRVDHQVKVRGHRIELEAVEGVIGEEPGIDACAVLVERGAADRLVALVAPSPSRSVRHSLQARMSDRLPRYAIPTEVLGVASLPRTGVGKVDRRAARAELDRRRAESEPEDDDTPR